MTTTPTAGTSLRKPLRLWPGAALAVVLALLWFVAPFFGPEAKLYGLFGSLISAVGIVLWWLFFSRAPWMERLGMVALAAASLFVTSRLVHESIAGGAMGFLLFVLSIPLLCLAFVAAVAATRRLADRPRRLAMAATIVLACGAWTLVRTGGFDSGGKNDFAWRWSTTPEERLLVAQAAEEPPPPPPAAAVAPAAAASASPAAVTAPATAAPPAAAPAPQTPPEPESESEPAAVWPGFRGPRRDGHVRGVRIKTDWSTSPPVEIWRREIGPGWSSFAVRGNFIYTQEQRGDDEAVTSYDLATGKPVWRHRDRARFWESNGGAGPRATPTLSGGRVYTLGGTGIVNVLDARTGARIWSRNAVSDTGAKIPTWGISGSPLVLDDVVIVPASGSMIAYDRRTGQPRWSGPRGGASYSSPQLVTIGGVEQVLMLSATGLTGVARADGKPLWSHEWKGYPIVQPGLTAEGDLLISVDNASGLRRLTVANGPGGWTARERWTSTGLKPYYSDFVVHKGHAYGLDGSILACIDLQDGQRKWKGGRYGQGQLVLLPEQDVLLLLAEEGDLALVSATTDGYKELARVPAIQGKTWNHPVLAGDVLLVRNAEEMAAYRLATDGP
jgi:outer membrane protein assembly factor BamB